MWLVASIPFWLIGVFLLCCAAYAVPGRRPGETNQDLVTQVFGSLLVAGIFLTIAAKIAA